MIRTLAAALVTSACIVALAPPATAQTREFNSSGSVPAEVSIANTRKIDLVSSVNGHSHTITVALPSEPAPSKGYRVIYVLDGYGYFGAMTEAVRANGNAPGTIVVGIGYPDTAAFVRGVIDRHGPLPAASAKAPRFMAAVGVERLYDMTLPATDEELADQSIAGLMEPKARDVGGLDDFLKTVEVDIKPRVAALAKVDLADQTLFGHSLGGLAVVHALFTTPNAFRTFVAGSPSIWWNHEKVLKGEAAFASKVTAGAVHPRVLITVGALEDQVPSLPQEMRAARSEIERLTKKNRMVDNARSLASRLKALPGQLPYQVPDAAVFADQDHGISVFPAIGRAVSFAVGK